MNTKNKLVCMAALLAMLSLLLFACDDNDELKTNEAPAELTIGEKQLKVVVGEQVELDIEKGNDDYKVFALNEKVAAVSISGNKLVIEALERGETSVIISDKSGQYLSVGLIIYYDELKIGEGNAIEFTYPIGGSRTKQFDITRGNGGYAVENSNPDVVEVSIEGEKVMMTSRKEGSAEVTVTDRMGFSTTLKVSISSSTIAFDEEELEQITQSENRGYFFDGELSNEDNTSAQFLNEEVDGKHLYGWDYFGYYYLKIYFEGDKQPGKKSATLDYSYSYNNFNNVPLDFEIIKNDGKMIWAVFSFESNGKLYYGYFIQNINP